MMKIQRTTGYAALSAALVSLIPAQAQASQKIEATFLDFVLNMPEDFNADLNKQMHWRPLLNSSFHGDLPSSGLLPKNDAFKNLTAFANFQATWFDSDRTPGFEGDFYSPMFGVSFQTLCDLNIGLVYSPSWIDYESFDNEVNGDGTAHRGGIYVQKHYKNGLTVGGAYMARTTDIDATYTGVVMMAPMVIKGDLDYDLHGASVGIGYAKKYGKEDTIGRNLAVNMSVNGLAYWQSTDIRNGNFRNSFGTERYYFGWLNKISHNVHKNVAVYASFDLYQTISEDDRDETPTDFNAPIPKGDDTFGFVGGGVVLNCPQGVNVTISGGTDVFRSDMDRWRVAVSLGYKF